MDLLAARLEQSGYRTRTWGLVSVDRPDLSVKDDIAALTNGLLRPLIVDEHRDIVLYLHSYAGFPCSAAIAGLSKSERSAKRQEGGIVGLVYQSAFVPIEGDTVLGMLGGKPVAWQELNVSPSDRYSTSNNGLRGKKNLTSHKHDTGLMKALTPKEIFYNDVPEPLATEASKGISDHSLGIFHPSSGPVFYGTEHFNNRRVYIHTTKDQALLPHAQRRFVENSGVEWDVRKIDAAHCPFLSEPTMLAEMLVGLTKGFVATY
ncbi:MAG: hypothetical protein LQ343_001015 [Gyalolechia ehrenbergii]|nr:MAG: hypothetical protein LQ343_001015 [Gyalolechia ehrenbergii]